jgi:hypothetical protein
MKLAWRGIGSEPAGDRREPGVERDRRERRDLIPFVASDQAGGSEEQDHRVDWSADYSGDDFDVIVVSEMFDALTIASRGARKTRQFVLKRGIRVISRPTTTAPSTTVPTAAAPEW